MELATSLMIPEIDKYAESVLNIPTRILMGRSGSAVARAVRELTPYGGKVIILAGKGNNGGDGYAAASELADEYQVSVYDVFSAGQRSDAGKYWLEKFRQTGADIVKYSFDPSFDEDLLFADCIVDAIFGTGFTGELSSDLTVLLEKIKRSRARKVAVDVPLGINADSGSVLPSALNVDTTVALSYIKPGLISYPAKAYTGKVVLDTLGIDREKIRGAFDFVSFLTDEPWAASVLPQRDNNSNKGSFGKALLVVGSERYRGAAHLSLEAALRGGVGYVTFAGIKKLSDELISKFPEALYSECTPSDHRAILDLSKRHNVTLIGSGSDCTEDLATLVRALLMQEGSPIILDADAINSISLYGGKELIKSSPRTVILTPHPLEFSRLSGLDVSDIQNNRIECARSFAKENGCILLLKGAATLITDGVRLYVNSSGSSALAKAGSGDVLAGLLASMLACSAEPVETVALAAYLHGRAGDNLAAILSTYGVIPSDLPKEIARILAELERKI